MAKIAVSSLLVALCGYTTAAQAARPPSESWTVAFRFENDLFAETDRFYTNGLKLSWVSPDLEWFRDLPWLRQDEELGDALDDLLQRLPYSGDPQRQRHVSLSLGQMMYTPRDILSEELLPADRPYAGWLYGGAAFHSKTYRRSDTFGIQAGFTGDLSLAEEAQDLVHRLRGFARARGWEHQIDTELAVALFYDRHYRYIPDMDFTRKWGLDAIANIGGAVGNAFTHANAGLEVRVGWNLPADFGTSLIRPGSETSAPADRTDPRYQDRFQSFSFHVYAAANGRAVLRDIFLDGNTFSDSHSVAREPLVGEFMLGASVSYRRLKLTYSYVNRTEEFERQPQNQGFGSVSVSYTY